MAHRIVNQATGVETAECGIKTRPAFAQAGACLNKKTDQGRNPGPVRKCQPRLEFELQCELNQARVIDGVSHLSKVSVGRRQAAGPVRRSKLRMVEEVKELRAEFDRRSFGNGRLLEDREVEVLRAILAQG